MATEQGRETRVLMKTGDNQFTKIGGETTFSFKRNRPAIDTSDKDGGKGTYGQASISLSLSGNVKLPDAGLEALEAASKLEPPEIEMKIMHGTVTRFQCVMGIGNFSADFPLNVATWSADATNSAAPTVDALTAVPA